MSTLTESLIVFISLILFVWLAGKINYDHGYYDGSKDGYSDGFKHGSNGAVDIHQEEENDE